MRVKDWIEGFLRRHKARFAPHDWPAEDATEEWIEFLRGWITGFATRVVTEEEANAASIALASVPNRPKWRGEHLPAIIAQVEASRRASGNETGASREAVREASRDCPHCGGDGLATAWASRPDPLASPETVAAHCVCRHGRWIRQATNEKTPELIRRIPDFQAVLLGYLPGWLDHPPGRPELAVGYQQRPAPVEAVPAFSRHQINEMFASPTPCS